MKLDRLGLRGDELEPLQQTRRQPRVTAHCRPLGSVETSTLAQKRRVDGNFAEIVESTCPAEPVDLGEREPKGAGETVDVAGDT